MNIEELEAKITHVEGIMDDIHDAIVGPKLTLNTGLIARISIMEKNITYLTTKFNEFENRAQVDRAATKIKLGIIWFLAGTLASGAIIFLFNLAVTHKP